jgi:hypothetical protein
MGIYSKSELGRLAIRGRSGGGVNVSRDDKIGEVETFLLLLASSMSAELDSLTGSSKLM